MVSTSPTMENLLSEKWLSSHFTKSTSDKKYHNSPPPSSAIHSPHIEFSDNNCSLQIPANCIASTPSKSSHFCISLIFYKPYIILYKPASFHAHPTGSVAVMASGIMAWGGVLYKPAKEQN
ncbi:hypothetical protein AVEN_194562-1 [Araneus ventricosus]|uniref:Uncharacterized protein n=1 Tax=Araneus ventricosus TaxID=182803 RepID=A0A4Y2A6K5_ARAVE|nr:hypothetical protein AVEN_194562-1 [Araneus ventricosus]